LGTALEVATTIVLVFVFFGQTISTVGISKLFNELSMAFMGRFRGGPAKVAVVAYSLFGMISGSAVANVATIGVFTIPLMKKAGYKPYFAAAVEAVSSTGGAIMPLLWVQPLLSWPHFRHSLHELLYCNSSDFLLRGCLYPGRPGPGRI
jgi:TRAP-type uncharacterized transport system fused permease subunit